MWQKKEKDTRETISIEEYLVRRKENRKKGELDQQSLMLPENSNWILAELYM